MKLRIRENEKQDIRQEFTSEYDASKYQRKLIAQGITAWIYPHYNSKTQQATFVVDYYRGLGEKNTIIKNFDKSLREYYDKEELQKEIDNFYQYLSDNFEYGLVYRDRPYISYTDDFWIKHYRTIAPKDFEKYMTGICCDCVAYEDYYFRTHFPEIKYNLYYFECCNEEEDIRPAHTWLAYTLNNKWYIFEVSWNSHKGIHEFDTEKEMYEYYIKELMKDSMEQYECELPLWKLLKFKQWNDYNMTCWEYMDRFCNDQDYEIKLIQDEGNYYECRFNES